MFLPSKNSLSGNVVLCYFARRDLDVRRVDAIENDFPGKNPNEGHKYVLVNNYHNANGYVPGYANFSLEAPLAPAYIAFTPLTVKVQPCDPTTEAGQNLYVTFTYSDSDPNNITSNRMITGDWEWPVPQGDLRLWTKDITQERNPASILDGGDFIPAGVRIPAEQLDLPGEKIIFIEGIRPVYELGASEIKLNVESENAALCDTCFDIVRCTPIQVNVDIDNFNDSGYAAVVHEHFGEDHYEDYIDGTNHIGRVIVVNDGNCDMDTLPDFADGYGLMGLPGTTVCTNNHFLPIRFEIPYPIDLKRARVKLSYSASDPMGVTTNGLGDFLLPGDGKLRIWTKDGNKRRNGKSVITGGDFLDVGEYSAEAFGFTNENSRILTYYVETVKPSDEVGDLRILFEVQPDERAGFMAADAVRVTAGRFELREVALDQNDYPITADGMPVLGDVIPWTDALSTYVPYDGGGAPALDSTASRWVTFSAVTNAVTNSATLTMTKDDVDGFMNWSLDFECVTTNGAYSWLWSGTSNSFLRAEVSTNAMAATMSLTLTYLDSEYGGLTNVVQEFYALSRHEQTNGFWGSTYSISDPREDIGMPAFSSRNAFVVRVPPLLSNLIQDGPVCTITIGDAEPVNVPLVEDGGGAYISCLVVPVSELDGETDLGLEISVPAIKIKMEGQASWETISIDIGTAIPGSMKKIANGKVPVNSAALFSALVTDEENGRARANQAVTYAGDTAIRLLKLGVTPLFSPTKEQINNMLARHRVWVHSGHGHHTNGIEIVMKTPSGGYRSDFFTASDITASGLKYDLVFMNTCESTDQRYDAIGAFPQRIIRWDGPYYYTDGTKVLDIGRKLNAKNYIGWDCSVVRALSVKIPAMLMEELDTRGSRPEDRRTVVDAVKAVQKRLIDKKPDFWYYWERFTLVDKDGSVILDLNKRKY